MSVFASAGASGRNVSQRLADIGDLGSAGRCHLQPLDDLPEQFAVIQPIRGTCRLREPSDGLEHIGVQVTLDGLALGEISSLRIERADDLELKTSTRA